jgi:hypothetical protein
MLVEVSLIQRFVLYLGHSTHALTAVLAGLLVGAGLGAWGASRFRGGNAAALAAALAAGVLVLANASQPPLLRATQGAAFPWRVLLAEMMVLPVGAALGTLMPLGIARLADRAAGLVPWAWGLNGFASAVGACAAALTSMAWGFSFTQTAGFFCYVLAALSAWSWRRYQSGEVVS